MPAKYKNLRFDDARNSKHNPSFARDVLLGLSRSPKALPSKYLYDQEGNRLFQQIMKLPEYYLTRCEFEILQKHKDRIANWIDGNCVNLVELGAGDGHKTEILLNHFLKRGMDFQYVPIDISETAMQGLIDGLDRYSSQLQTEGLVAEYFDGLKWLSDRNQKHNVILFLGSNIGNLTCSEARVFLDSLWNALNNGDYLLIGFDLKKNIEQLLRAYNDTQGITAQFNLNLLRRINRELKGNFDLNGFKYYSTYNVSSGAIESYLISCEKQVVHVETLNHSFSFEAWEPVHTEWSHKYLQSDIALLAKETGFEIIDQLFDSRHYFVDSIWQVRK